VPGISRKGASRSAADRRRFNARFVGFEPLHNKGAARIFFFEARQLLIRAGAKPEMTTHENGCKTTWGTCDL